MLSALCNDTRYADRRLRRRPQLTDWRSDYRAELLGLRAKPYPTSAVMISEQAIAVPLSMCFVA